MDNFHILLTDVLGAYLQAWNFKSIQDMIITDHVSEDDMIALLKHHGPHEPDEYIDDAVSDLCREILPLLYRIKKWYRLIGFIYGMGYGAETIDSLCGSRHPLAFGAAERNPEFVKAFIVGQKRFDYLSFDGERRCEDGQYRTLPEELVFIDCVEVVSLCLENGMNPNTFAFDGRRILEVSRSEKMRELLLAHGATNATTQERNLVWATNELKHECLRRNTMNAFFSTEPLLKLSWFNGSTENSREQKADIFFEAALSCHAELLEELYPYAQKDLDNEQQKKVLRAILGQHSTLPCGRILDERPVDIARSLEALSSAGFRYGANHESDVKHPILAMINSACWTFSFREMTSYDTQLRVFTALWEIGGSPKGEAIIKALAKLVEEHPLTTLEMFLYRVKNADEEE